MAGDVVPSLKPNASDVAVGGLQAITSLVDVLVPGAGSFFGMLAGQIIPYQRNERLAEYATRLSRRLRVAEEGLSSLSDSFAQLAQNLGPEQRALFEDGAAASILAISEERLDGIAKLVADGINSDDLAASEQRRILQLLGDLSEEDVIVLASYTGKLRSDDTWRTKHESVLQPIRAHMGSDQEEMDRDTLRQLRTHRLLNLGVLEEKPTANGRSTNRSLSRLGRYVLRKLGVLQPDES